MVKYPNKKPESFSTDHKGKIYTGTRTLKGVTKVFVEMEFKGEYLTDDKQMPVTKTSAIDMVSRRLLRHLVEEWLNKNSIS